MRDVALRALDTARMRGASYVDVRIVRFKSESVTARKLLDHTVADVVRGALVRRPGISQADDETLDMW
jgi:hypothetical protein